MNDPHVTSLQYWVNHDDSVDYADALPMEHENELFHIRVSGRQVTVRPKSHYASEAEAKAAIENFIRHWEFEAALESGSSSFALGYSGADVIDRNPIPPPPGVVQLSTTARAGHPTVGMRLRESRRFYPSPPSGRLLDPDERHVQAMLSQLDRYHQGRSTLASMAYFCLTTLEGSVPKSNGKANKDKLTRDHYAISRRVLEQVRRLSSEKGGYEARKGIGLDKDFTKDERSFLVAAVQALIRRTAERAANPTEPLPKITMAGLPQLQEQ